MQFISAHAGKLQTIVQGERRAARSFVTGLQALDALAPGQAFARGAVHELLFQPGDGEPNFLATILAQKNLPMIWSDPHRQLYPPALASLGFDLTKLNLLRPDRKS